MSWVRSRWFLRCTALLLVGAMLPPVLASSGHAATGSLTASYAGWIRAQLRMPADAAVEEALNEAARAEARSFESFVEVFLEAYSARHDRSSAAHAFVEEDLSDEALIAYLQRRYTEISGEAVLLGFRTVAASLAPACSSVFYGPLAGYCRGDLPSATWLQAPQDPAENLAVRRPVSPARPQGP